MSAPVEQLHRDFELLTRKLLQLVPRAGNIELPVPGLRCFRRDGEARAENGLFSPSLCVVVQGSLRLSFGEEDVTLYPGQCLMNCVDMHTRFFAQGSPDKPFLALALQADSALFMELFREVDAAEASGCARAESERETSEGMSHQASSLERGMRISHISPEFSDAFLRLISLKDAGRIRFIAPLIIREMYYYLVSGQHGAYLRAFYASSAQSGQIARIIAYMKEHCHERLRIETLARMANMAESTFNRNFRKVTTLSPLQYHKNLKLHEARHLMIHENLSAAAACYAVGYESQQQFTREYKRLFGSPPMKDARRSQ